MDSTNFLCEGKEEDEKNSFVSRGDSFPSVSRACPWGKQMEERWGGGMLGDL